MIPNRSSCQLVVLVLLLMVPQGKAPPKPPEAALAAITRRGIFLAEYDSAAWHATDAVKALRPALSRLGQYIARKTEVGWVVDFGRLNESGDKFLVAYEAVEANSPAKFEVKRFYPTREVDGWDLAAAKGIDTAMRDFGRVSRPYNTAALPAEPEGMYVYLYPAQTRAGVYPFGGDVRYHVSADGTKIIEKHQMHKTIIDSVTARRDIKVAAGYHTDIFGDLPEDTDVLLVLKRSPEVPEIVITRAYMFKIDVDGKITVEHRPHN